jgi:cytochrome P450
LAEELETVLAGRMPTLADLDRLPFTRAMIDETMRLYPPGPFLGRVALGDDEICGVPIPAGSDIQVSPWIVHRHRMVWEEPELFAPDRFLDGRRRALPRGAFIPFGLGPRICIGQSFAIQEMLVAVATIVPRYRFRLATDKAVMPRALVTLQPEGGLPIVLEPRREA